MVKRRDCFYTSQNEYVKAPNLCICLPKPIDTYSKNVRLFVLTGTKSFEAQASIVPIQPNRSGVF